MEQKLNTNWWPDKYPLSETENTHTKTSVYVSGNDDYKQQVNKSQTLSKRGVIAALKLCNYRTPPKEVAKLLEALFINYESKEGHWLYVAQHWNPRVINRVIALMIKQHQRRDITIKNPPGYFTSIIKFRKKRRNLTGINGTRKQQEKEYERRSSETRGGGS